MTRIDGRKDDELRGLRVERSFMKYAEGSCFIQMGNTKVICSASVDENVPPFLKGSGNGWVTAEYGMLPRSCQSRIQRGKDSGRTFEIQRLIGRSLRSVTDMREMGERTIWIDCDVLQGDGGTRTAAITGAFIALVEALSWMKNKGMVQRIPIKEFVAAISVGILGGDLLLDLAYAEDSKADVDMNVVMTSGGKFIEVQGTSERKPFGKDQLDKLLKLASLGIESLIGKQREVLKDIV